MRWGPTLRSWTSQKQSATWANKPMFSWPLSDVGQANFILSVHLSSWSPLGPLSICRVIFSMSSLGSSWQVVLDVKWTAIQLEMSETWVSEWLQQKIAIGDILAFPFCKSPANLLHPFSHQSALCQRTVWISFVWECVSTCEYVCVRVWVYSLELMTFLWCIYEIHFSTLVCWCCGYICV